MDEKNHIKPEVREEQKWVGIVGLLQAIVDNLKILTYTVKEDRAHRLKTQFNAWDFSGQLSASTTDQTFKFTEPVTSYVVSVPVFASATQQVFIAFEQASGSHTITLTQSLPSISLGGLPVKNFRYSTSTGAATVQVVGLRGE